jgi:hypothetical protein
MHSSFCRAMRRLAAALVIAAIASSSQGGEIQITVTNDQTAGGFGLAPVWFGVQDGSFNVFSQGSTASSQLATLAQFGNTAPLASLFAGNGPETTLTSGGSIAQFQPGQSNSTILNVANPSVDQYLSFAGMVVPSNDLFMGNATPLQIFNSNGTFAGPMTIQIYGSDVWDSDTEAQSITTALTFIQGQTPGSGTQIANGSITPFLTEAGAAGFLQSITGLTTIAGYNITHEFDANDLIATIQISSVPEPSSVVLLGMGAAAALIAARKARSRNR